MSERTTKSVYGNFNLHLMYTKNAGLTGVVTPAIYTFDRIVNTAYVGTVQKKAMIITFDSKDTSSGLETILAEFQSNVIPTTTITEYEDRNTTTKTLVPSGTLGFVMVSFNAANGDTDIGQHTYNMVFSGNTGDFVNLGGQEHNGRAIELTAINNAILLTVDATAYPSTVVLTPAAVTIAVDSIGDLTYLSAA